MPSFSGAFVTVHTAACWCFILYEIILFKKLHFSVSLPYLIQFCKLSGFSGASINYCCYTVVRSKTIKYLSCHFKKLDLAHFILFYFLFCLRISRFCHSFITVFVEAKSRVFVCPRVT
jgi:hypothetical protein